MADFKAIIPHHSVITQVGDTYQAVLLLGNNQGFLSIISPGHSGILFKEYPRVLGAEGGSNNVRSSFSLCALRMTRT